MDIGAKIKEYRKQQNLSQDELALKAFVSRQTISNWETNKNYPDIKSLVMLSNIFNVTLDDFTKGDVEEMRKCIDKESVKKFNLMGCIFFAELLIMAISAYPLFKLDGYIGIVIWGLIFFVTLGTSVIVERFKKTNDIQTYKEIVAFMDGKQLTYEEVQQEKGKRLYQKIFLAILTGVVAFIIFLSETIFF